MRSSSDSNLTIDWDSFNAVNRHVKESESVNAVNDGTAVNYTGQQVFKKFCLLFFVKLIDFTCLA